MKQNNVEKYFQYETMEELYEQYKIEFFELIDKNLAEWSASNLLKEYYLKYEFNSIRLLLDDRTSTWERFCKNNISRGESVKANNIEFKKWKEVENNFLTFFDIYDSKIQNEIC